MNGVILRTNEMEALRVLAEYDILHSLPEKEYNDLVALASLICRTPYAFLNFIGEDIQWTKASHGNESGGGIPRCDSVCTYTVLNAEPLVIPNLQSDPRTKNLPAVIGNEKLLFYAGVPLTSPAGHRIGAICVVDKYPHELTQEQLSALVSLSRQLISLLELRKKRKELQDLSENKSRFLAFVSHEVRNPLNALTGYLQLLDSSKNTHVSDKADLRECLYLVDNISNIVDEVLEFSKLENSNVSINVSTFNLAELFNKMNSSFMPQAIRLGLDYESDLRNLDIFVKSDPCRINQICQNLFSNALKFTKSGKISFNVQLIGSGEPIKLHITLSDTGKGIEQSKLISIFEPFKQEDASIEQRFGGTGLGLAIVKNITNLLNGEIYVESEVGKGSKFDVWLPLSMEVGARDEVKHLIPVELLNHDLRVLLIEDNQSNILVMQKIFTRFELSLDVAPLGAEGVRKAKSQHYDIAFIDHQLPDMLGTDVVKELKSIISPPVLISFTANVFDDDVRKYFSSGFDDILAKPARIESVIELILKWQSGKKLRTTMLNQSKEF